MVWAAICVGWKEKRCFMFSNINGLIHSIYTCRAPDCTGTESALCSAQTAVSFSILCVCVGQFRCILMPVEEEQGALTL